MKENPPGHSSGSWELDASWMGVTVIQELWTLLASRGLGELACEEVSPPSACCPGLEARLPGSRPGLSLGP